ncbi:MAG: RNA methyltransferase [Alphaproteobacteria bacterium]|nr:RNA methyltransferase [Alphaproteobacteria bacterium]
MTEGSLIFPPAIVLSHTQMGENIGSAARAMKNFGLGELILIAPKCGWPNDRAQMLASGAADIIEAAQVFDTTEAALAPYSLVLATTARGRDVVKEIYTPQAAARHLRATAKAGARTAILFGNERAGLTNEEMSLADGVITIPTADFWSLNLAQAVLVTAYEWLKSADATPATRIRATVAVPATRHELTGLFEHLERELDAAEFLFPPAKRETMVRNIRAMIMRSRLSDQEVRTIRGMIVALVRNKYRGKQNKNGDQDG